MELSTINKYEYFNSELYAKQIVKDGNIFVVDESSSILPNLMSSCYEHCIKSENTELFDFLVAKNFIRSHQIIKILLSTNQCYQLASYYLQNIDVVDFTLDEWKIILNSKKCNDYFNIISSKRIVKKSLTILVEEAILHKRYDSVLKILVDNCIINSMTIINQYTLLEHVVRDNKREIFQSLNMDEYEFDRCDYRVFFFNKDNILLKKMYSKIKYDMEKEYLKRKGLVLA